MKLVRENIDFKRGNIRRTLGLGEYHNIPKPWDVREFRDGIYLIIKNPDTDYESWGKMKIEQDSKHIMIRTTGYFINVEGYDDGETGLDSWREDNMFYIKPLRYTKLNREDLYDTINQELRINYDVIKMMDENIHENLSFERGIESRKALRVGANYAPGAEKDFEDVESGDETIDYADEHGIVLDKMKTKIGLDYEDELVEDTRRFLRRYDSTGAMDDALRNPDSYGLEDMDDIKMIAVDMDGKSIVYTYGGEGAIAIW